MGHVWTLASEIGPRVAGEQADDRAVAYLADYWRRLGYEPTITPFTFTGYEEREVKLESLSSGEVFNGSILRGGPTGFVQAELIDVGLGTADETSTGLLQGRIALMKRGDLRFSDKVNNAAAAGAVGAVIDNNQPGGFMGSLSGPSPIPAIGISQEDGQALRGQLARGSVEAMLRADGGTRELTAANVLTSYPGHGDGLVIIGAHIDSVSVGQGANDNASGVAVVAELSRAVLGQDYPFEVRFVAFGAEEVGLVGSAQYVARMPETERARATAMINLDMVGVGTQWRFGGSPDLVNLALAAARDLGETGGRMGSGLNTASDHASFLDAGVPSVFVHRFDDPNYHTARDLADVVDATNLETAGHIVLTVLDRLAGEHAV